VPVHQWLEVLERPRLVCRIEADLVPFVDEASGQPVARMQAVPQSRVTTAAEVLGKVVAGSETARPMS